MDTKSAFGICVCGLNGSGKTTLARALARELGFEHMDVETYYFSNAENPYATSRTREQVEDLLLADIRRCPRFVFSAVNGNMNSEINAKYSLVVYLQASVDIRMKRIRQRAVDQFGDRVLPGGDMYEQEQKFFEFAAKRDSRSVEAWLSTLSCRVLRLDGTYSIADNVKRIIEKIII